MGDAGLTVSVVISTLNAGRSFGTVLHRITEGSRAVREILCLDAGSQDGTRHIVSQFPAARFVTTDDAAGPQSWNRGMEESRGDIVAFLAQDALPASTDWLSQLASPFDDPSVGGVYGRQVAAGESDALAVFRLEQRYCLQAHQRRARVGDPIRYKSLPFIVDNAAIRRSAWRGIHFNEKLPVGADRVWARQMVLASYTIAYAPDALVLKAVPRGWRSAFHLAFLTGFTDRHYGDEGGTLWPDSVRFYKRAAWRLLKEFEWTQLPRLVAEEAAQRYGYRKGFRLGQLDAAIHGPDATATGSADENLVAEERAA